MQRAPSHLIMLLSLEALPAAGVYLARLVTDSGELARATVTLVR